MTRLIKLLPASLRWKVLFFLGLSRIPMMRYLRPRIVELSDQKVVVRVRHRRRTRNMYGSMYLGALAVGADCVAGFFPAKYMLETGRRVPPIIRSGTSEFYKRVNSTAHFTCDQGAELVRLCERAVASGERHEMEVTVTVTAPDEHGEAPVARFTHIVSLKKLG